MTVNRGYDIPEFFPRPRIVELSGGDSSLAVDVRLTTRNVLPIQRKAVRSILTAAGVHVVANKKTYIVDACVMTPADFDLSDVPEEVRNEYYELQVNGSEVYMKSPQQDGMVWAAQTLAVLFRQIIAGKKVPNMILRDWPEKAVRGLMVDGRWGTDRMSQYDWCALIDTMSAMKMNTLCVGIYDCVPSCRYQADDRPAEFLNIPIDMNDSGEQYIQQYRVRWYHAGGDFWHDEVYDSPMVQKNMFNDVVVYGREHGVNVVPVVSSLGNNTLLPRLFPAASALDARGRATGFGYCLSSPEARAVIEKIYGGIIDKYYGGSMEAFHIRLDELKPDYPRVKDPMKKEKPACRCKDCSAQTDEERLANYVVWLVGFLVGKGVKKVVVWRDFFYGQNASAREDILVKLEAAGLKDHLVFHYYHDDTMTDNDEVAAIQPNLWLGPKVAEQVRQSYGNFNEGVDAFIRSNGKADGIVGCGVTDPAQLDALALLAFHGWEPADEMPYGKIMQRWSQARFGASAEVFFHAVKDLSDAWHLPEIAVCQQMQYCIPDENSKTWPRPYPEEALKKLESMAGADKVLATAAKRAQEVITGLRGLLNNDKLTASEQECVNSLIGDALHLQMLANIFGWLLALRQDLSDGGAKKNNFTSCAELCDGLVDGMKQFETLKPAWTIPYSLQVPSYLLIYLRQLYESLKAQVNHKKGAAISWSLPNDWQVPEN